MLIIGGTFPLQPEYCDTIDAYGTHNLNLGANGPRKSLWDWFHADIIGYTVPQVIYSRIGGGYAEV